jgi:hypothetical protein
MSKCYVIGKKAKLAANGHEYIAEPFIVFEGEGEAIGACDMVEKITGERPMQVEAALYRTGSTRGAAAKK